jgi:DNA topoisomerase IB
VTVPVTQAAPDPSYILDTTATVTSEELARDNKTYGYVTVRTRRGESESNRTLFSRERCP